jgi:LAS superfamily LD-carboxypeptidase LdcB
MLKKILLFCCFSSSISAQNITIDYVMGKFDPAKDKRFVKMELKHADKADMYLRKETYDAFKKMHAAALKDGVSLKIISATRNFARQKAIWEGKWNKLSPIKTPKDRALKILEFSSMPGSSRHHWGTDMDLNHLTNEHFNTGAGKKIYDWLTKNAATYGFYQPYTAGRTTGYQEEKWHWTYLPLSKPLTEFVKTSLSDAQIKGFLGSETAISIEIVKRYILGINVLCLN